MFKYSVLVRFEHKIDGQETWLTAFTGADKVIAMAICRREAEKGREALLLEIDKEEQAS